jgi:serine/threonine-protein kinase
MDTTAKRLRDGVSFADDGPVLSCGPFTLIDALATGGMGEVWLAAPRGLPGAPDLVVLKRIKSELADNDGAVTRFVDESRLGLMLRHPCISRTIDAGRADGSDYLAAELVEGIDLSVLLGRAAKARLRIEPLLSCWMMAMALDGLDYAHNARHPISGEHLGVVHRDISPANLMATRDGVVRVIDFGLALSSVREAHTQMGIVLGKLGYMSPEQARGRPVSGPCDVFAAGVVLYELIVGKRHYGAIPRERLAAVVGAGTFKAALADEVDRVTNGLYSAMLHKDPAARPTAGQARDALLAHVAQDGGPALATERLAALITDVAAPELARFDQATEKARALPPPTVESGPTTFSIALSESHAVRALLDTQPPAITLAPGQMWQASPSLLAIARVAEPPTISTPARRPTSSTPFPDTLAAVDEVSSQLPTSVTSKPSAPVSSSPPQPMSSSPTRALVAASVVAVAVVVLGVFLGLHSTASDDTGTATAAVPAPVSPPPDLVVPIPQPPAAPAPLPAPEPSPAPSTTTTTTTPTTTTTTTTTPATTKAPASDPLFERVRRLSRCGHACAVTFAVPAKTGLAGYSAARRQALEGLVKNCERFCP